jgi:tetratricopeptide (TPR) repeat protein
MSLDAARQLLLARRPELAERELRRWLALQPEDAAAQALLAWSLAVQGKAEAGMEAEAAVRLAPDWAHTHTVLGEVRMRLGLYRTAERALRDALALQPDDAQIHALLAASILDQGIRSRAREVLAFAEAGLALDPGHAACARVRALALIRLGRFWKARRAAAFALNLDPEDASGHAIAGWAQYATGRRRAARNHLREALRTDPENEYAQQGLWRADEWPVFAAAIMLETETHPRWLRAAALLHAASVSLSAVRGPDAVGPLLWSLLILLVMEAWTLPVRVTARGRARMQELRVPCALPPRERLHTRIVLKCFLAVAILIPLFVYLP